MFRGVRVRSREAGLSLRGAPDWVGTRRAELCGRGQEGPAALAQARQRGGALLAELRLRWVLVVAPGTLHHGASGPPRLARRGGGVKGCTLFSRARVPTDSEGAVVGAPPSHLPSGAGGARRRARVPEVNQGPLVTLHGASVTHDRERAPLAWHAFEPMDAPLFEAETGAGNEGLSRLRETRMSRGRAKPATRAPMWTAMPPSLPPISSWCGAPRGLHD